MAAVKILVIKLSALGDFIQALGPMKAIRSHHKKAHITLLTTKAFKNLAEQSGYFDSVQIDDRPKAYQILKILKLCRFLNKGFTRIYDLQNNDRTNIYFRYLKHPQPEWVGVARGASHRNISPKRTEGLAFDGHCQTLGLAGVTNIEIDDLSWMEDKTKRLTLPKDYALFITGSAPTRPEKRWDKDKFRQLAKNLISNGVTPVLIGTESEIETNDFIAKDLEVQNLTGQTQLNDIVHIARKARYVIGNDTGPMHMASVTGAKCVVLFNISKSSNPKRHRPLGHNVSLMAHEDIQTISVNDVIEHLDTLSRTKSL